MRKYKERITLTPEQIQEIKENFKAQGIVQQALAERFGITSSVLGSYMNGRLLMPSLVYERLKKILNLKK